VEVPGLCVSSIWCLDHKVSVVNEVEISVSLELRNNVEISFNIHTEVFVEFTLGWFLWHLVSIDEIPLLVESLVLFPDNDILVLSILSLINIHDLSSFINKIDVLVSKELPPS
jgi:hypothetical protein